jgi:hypothetical protein
MNTIPDIFNTPSPAVEPDVKPDVKPDVSPNTRPNEDPGPFEVPEPGVKPAPKA